MLHIDYFTQESLHEMIGLRVYELKQDKDRDVRDNTSLCYVSEEVLKLSAMKYKFDALDVSCDETPPESSDKLINKGETSFVDTTFDNTIDTTTSEDLDTIIDAIGNVEHLDSEKLEQPEIIEIPTHAERDSDAVTSQSPPLPPPPLDDEEDTDNDDEKEEKDTEKHEDEKRDQEENDVQKIE